MKIYACSRRTITDGEVVTYATDFRKSQHSGGYDPFGPFEISASRNAVIVHRATIKHPEDVAAVSQALAAAYAAMMIIPQRAGSSSVFPSTPTELQAAKGGGE